MATSNFLKLNETSRKIKINSRDCLEVCKKFIQVKLYLICLTTIKLIYISVVDIVEPFWFAWYLSNSD